MKRQRSVAATRVRYLAFAAVTIACGLAVHLKGTALPRDVRDVLGDALWAAMIYWLIAFAAPRMSRAVRFAAALGVCWMVELSQLIRSEWLRELRSTTVGHLVLGSDFFARDLVAYAAGVTAAMLLHLLYDFATERT